MSRPDRATFRLPAPAFFFPVLLFVCIVPLATAGGAWGVMFVVPVLALVWVLVTRTKATPAGVIAYGLLGPRRMAWTEMDGLELKESQWAIAVGTDGRRLRLPMVRPRDLPRLAAVSGGSLLFGEDAAAAAAAAQRAQQAPDEPAPQESDGPLYAAAADPSVAPEVTNPDPIEVRAAGDHAAAATPVTAGLTADREVAAEPAPAGDPRS